MGWRQEAEEAVVVERTIEMKSQGGKWEVEEVVVAWERKDGHDCHRPPTGRGRQLLGGVEG